jgi:integrase
MKIRARKHRSGNVTWQLDLGLVEGRRVQRSYGTEREAKAALRAAQEAQARHGSMASELTGSAMAEMVLAREKLRAVGTSITEAVEFYLKHARRRKERVRLAEGVERFRDARERAGCSVRYLRQLGVSLGSLARWRPMAMMDEIERDDVVRWLEAGGWSPKTRNGYLGDVRACFEWAVREGLCAVNPAREIAKAKLGDGEIGTLTLGQCEELLLAALAMTKDEGRRTNGVSMMGFIVLGMFGGLRPAEIQRLDWSAVDVEEGTVIVAGAQAKTRRRRVVDLSGNAVEWLRCAQNVETRMRNEEGPICGRYWDARWRMFRRSLGWAVGSGERGITETVGPGDKEWGRLGLWPHNALRHTYASMHYAMWQDEAKLQAQMGHESAAMLHRHYRALKMRKEAERFWALRP